MFLLQGHCGPPPPVTMQMKFLEGAISHRPPPTVQPMAWNSSRVSSCGGTQPCPPHTVHTQTLSTCLWGGISSGLTDSMMSHLKPEAAPNWFQQKPTEAEFRSGKSCRLESPRAWLNQLPPNTSDRINICELVPCHTLSTDLCLAASPPALSWGLLYNFSCPIFPASFLPVAFLQWTGLTFLQWVIKNTFRKLLFHSWAPLPHPAGQVSRRTNYCCYFWEHLGTHVIDWGWESQSYKGLRAGGMFSLYFWDAEASPVIKYLQDA